MMLKAVLAHNADEGFIDDIVRIDKDSFPDGWAFDDAKEYYTGLFNSERNICIVLKNNEAKVGYLVAVPHNNAKRDLEEDDNLIQEDALRFYIETVAILPAYRQQNCFSMMFNVLLGELGKRNIHKISLHARVRNNFSAIIQKKIKVTQIRRIERWKYYNFDESTDYIEGDLFNQT